MFGLIIISSLAHIVIYKYRLRAKSFASDAKADVARDEKRRFQIRVVRGCVVMLLFVYPGITLRVIDAMWCMPQSGKIVLQVDQTVVFTLE